ncbi:hypothetical protein D3C86_1568550 [compost metagenome]
MSCALRAGHSQQDEEALEHLPVVPALKHLLCDAGRKVRLFAPQAAPVGLAGLHHLDEELIFAAVVAIDQRRIDLGSQADVAHADRFETLLGEELQRRAQEDLTGDLGASHSGARFRMISL